MRHGRRKGIFGLAVAAALVFGGAQAFASPAAAAGTARACNPATCDQDCKARRFDGGVCSLGDCVCYIGL